MVANKENNNNQFIKAKEYFSDKRCLCSPSLLVTEYFRGIQNICVSHLK